MIDYAYKNENTKRSFVLPENSNGIKEELFARFIPINFEASGMVK
jgi:hypothetical protein